MLKFLGKTVCETATYPIKTINAGRYIYKKWGDKDLAGILRDPAIVVRDGIAGLAKRFTGLVFDKASLGILKMPGENLKTK
jgi:hypothetical protein